MNSAHTRTAVLVAVAGMVALPAMAQPPARQIPIVRTPTPAQQAPPPAAAQPSPGASQGTVPVSIGGQTLNVSPSDAANIAAWKDKLRQLAIAKGINPVKRTDGLPTYLNTREYVVPTNDGKGEGVVSLPENFQVGVWFAGSGADGYSFGSLAKTPLQGVPVDQSTVIGQLIGPTVPNVQTQLTRLTPVEMTPEAVEAAKAKYPKSEGWSEVWLPGGGKMFAKTNPVDLANSLSTLRDAWGADPQRTGVQSVDDLARAYKVWSERCRRHCGTVRDLSAYGRPRVEDETAPKYTIASDAIPSQIDLINESKRVIEDNGRLDRALAISELQQLPTWKSGVQRLAATYLAHPELAMVPLAEDFSDLTDPAIRKMLNQIVADANRNSDAKGLVAAASLMASDRRVEAALNTLSRARRFSTEQSDKDAIDGLFAAINALLR